MQAEGGHCKCAKATDEAEGGGNGGPARSGRAALRIGSAGAAVPAPPGFVIISSSKINGRAAVEAAAATGPETSAAGYKR